MDADSADSADSVAIAGSYRVESVERYDQGSVRRPFGERPEGMLLYGTDGAMAAVVGAGGRPHLEMDLLADSGGASEADLAAAFRSAYGFAGTYEVEGDVVRHRIDVSTMPNWVGTEQVRPFELSDETLTLYPPGWRLVARRWAPPSAKGAGERSGRKP